MNNKAGYISNLNAFQEHERQQRRIAQMNIELSEHELSYYRLAILLSFILLSGTSLVFRIKQSKKKVEMSLKEKELAMVRLQNSQWETEIKYLQEKHDREAIEIESLNQSVEYYKRLNALTVPILMKSQNSQGAMHMKRKNGILSYRTRMHVSMISLFVWKSISATYIRRNTFCMSIEDGVLALLTFGNLSYS